MSQTSNSADIQTLTCCCCGESTKGRQWWNRDTGFGVCSGCIEFVRRQGEPEEQIRNYYGIEGVHWGVDQ